MLSTFLKEKTLTKHKKSEVFNLRSKSMIYDHSSRYNIICAVRNVFMANFCDLLIKQYEYESLSSQLNYYYHKRIHR